MCTALSKDLDAILDRGEIQHIQDSVMFVAQHNVLQASFRDNEWFVLDKRD